jgi:NADPH:quinone reductase-like Zn-dependent oxidoreductase
MKAMVIKEFGGPDVFVEEEVPTPEPGLNELLVRVKATSVNPVDYQTRRGDYPDIVPLPALLGMDVSGVVEKVGEGVEDFAVGDEAYYMPTLFGGPGSYAQYHVADKSIVARKPSNLSHVEAASFPLTGGTVWDCLVTRGQLQVGESVLIHAGAGGVGSFAIQLAKAMGAYVFTTCSERNVDLPKSLGADRVIDYRKEDYVAVIREETDGAGVHLVLDTLGGDTIERSFGVLRPFGRLVTIVDIPRPQNLLEAWDKNATVHFVFVTQYAEKLDRMRELIERGQIRPVIDSVLPLTEVAKAHERLQQGGVRGKIVLEPGD